MSDLMLSQTLRHSLAEWTDPDIASYYVAVALGVAPDPGAKWDSWGGQKWMFWSANPLGNGLFGVLQMLVECGVLEEHKDDMKFRWNSKFDWEKYGQED